MSKDLLVLADEYAAATATFARALALKDSADSMSPIARDAGDKRAVLAEALAALDTAQQEPVNQVLLKALSALLTHSGMDEDEWSKPTFDQARAAIKLATTKTKECGMCGYVGTEADAVGQCPRCHWDELQLQKPAKQAQPEPFTPDWSQDSAAAESIREHQAICNLLLKEMRHIADISTGQVKRVAEQALEAVKQAQPERALSDAVWLSELLRRALPYVKDASVRYYDGTDGHSMRQSAKGLLEKIEAAIKQGGQHD